jgi:F-type H+-transporting ATPase subunit epsilon
MAKTIRCDIVSAEEEIFSGQVNIVIATATFGELGIMPGHSPLLTGIKPGPIVLRLPDGTNEAVYASGGYLEVQPGIVTVLADTAVRAKDLDEASAVAAREDAARHMTDRTADFNYSAAQATLLEAAAQLKTIRRLKDQLPK